MEGLQKFQHFNFVHSYSIIAFHVNKSQMPSENKVYQLNSPSIRVIKTNVVIGQLLKSGGGGREEKEIDNILPVSVLKRSINAHQR